MVNPFLTFERHISGPATAMVPITPSDTVDLNTTAVALYIESGGTVRFKSVSGRESTVQVGNFSTIPVGVVKVFATGTTATGIHGYAHEGLE